MADHDDAAPDAVRAIVTRDEAKALGLQRFYLGTICRNGHVDERLVANGKCAECQRGCNARYQTKYHDERRAYARAYYEVTREHQIAKAMEWVRNHPERHGEHTKRWARENRDKANAIRHRRRARLAEVGGTHTAQDLADLLIKQKHKCANCLCKIGKGCHADHIVPLALGGSNDIRNIQLLCGPCNWSKHAKDPIDFARMNGRLL